MEQEKIMSEIKDTLSAKVSEVEKKLTDALVSKEDVKSFTDELADLRKMIADVEVRGKGVDNKLVKTISDSLDNKGKEIEIAQRHFSDSLAAPTFATPVSATRLRDSYAYHFVYDIMEKVYVNTVAGTFNLPGVTAEWNRPMSPVVNPDAKNQSPRDYSLLRLQSLETIPFDYKVFGIENLNMAGFAQMENKIRKAMSDAVLNGVTVDGVVVKGLKDTTNEVLVADTTKLVSAILGLIDVYGPTARVILSPEVFDGIDFQNTAAANIVLSNLLGGGLAPEAITRAWLPTGVYAYVFAGNTNIVAEKSNLVVRSFEDMGSLYTGAFYYGIPSLDLAMVTAIKKG